MLRFFPKLHILLYGKIFSGYDDWKLTGDNFVLETIPALIICYFMPEYGVPILIFHYFYEVFFSDGVLDHNPNIKEGGIITKFFAIGQWHLKHHNITPNGNFGLYITLWDHLFGTVI